MPVAKELSGFSDFERVTRFDDAEAQLCAIIAIHSTALGPAAGGCRFTRYPGFDEAAADAAALAHGMSRKNAMADLPLGGGKSVIRMPDGEFDRDRLMRAFGEAVDSLGGAYITAEDVGTGVADMQQIARATRFVAGLPKVGDHAGGDPSPWTGLGVFLSIRHVAGAELQRPLGELTVAVQGAGSVGANLCRRLSEAGATVLVADTNAEKLAALADLAGVEAVAPDKVLGIEADILAPCAMGGVLTPAVVDGLQVRAIAGAANNQIAGPEAGAALQRRGILYCPDFIINAGGIISVSAEYLGEDEDAVSRRVARIPERLAEVIGAAREQDVGPEIMADRMADERIAAAGTAAEAAGG